MRDPHKLAQRVYDHQKACCIMHDTVVAFAVPNPPQVKL